MGIKPTGIAVIATYDCNASCPHCFFENKKKEKTISSSLLKQALKSLNTTLQWIHITGGEPFLNPDSLDSILLSIEPSANQDIGIATNGFWAQSEETAKKIVCNLQQKGVTGITLSVDVFHQKWIPFSRIEFAARAIKEAGINRHSYIVCSVLPENHKQSAEVNNRSLRMAHSIANKTGMPVAKTTIRPLGQGSFLLSSKAKKKIPSGKCQELSCCLGKKGPINPEMVWIDPFGNVMICYGLVIGSLKEKSLQSILEEYSPSNFPVLKELMKKGPKAFYDMAIQEKKAPKPPFWDECDLCFKSRQTLRYKYPSIFSPDQCYPDRKESKVMQKVFQLRDLAE